MNSSLIKQYDDIEEEDVSQILIIVPVITQIFRLLFVQIAKTVFDAKIELFSMPRGFQE